MTLSRHFSLTLSRHFSLSFIASGRSSGLHPISSHSCMYVLAGCPAFARPYVGVHRSTSLMSLYLLLQQCPACPIRLTWIVFMMGGRWPYSWCFVGCCCLDLFNIRHILYIYICACVCIYIYIYIYDELSHCFWHIWAKQLSLVMSVSYMTFQTNHKLACKFAKIACRRVIWGIWWHHSFSCCFLPISLKYC